MFGTTSCYRINFAHGFSLFMILLVYLQITSCAVSKIQPTVFEKLKGDTVLSISKPPVYNDVIKIKDELIITISSLNPEMDEIFNKSGSLSSLSNKQNIYLVNDEGKIKLHHIGLTKVVGMSLSQFAESLEKQLEPYYKDLLVNVKFANKNITVMGMVNNPKIISLEHGGITFRCIGRMR